MLYYNKIDIYNIIIDDYALQDKNIHTYNPKYDVSRHLHGLKQT